MNFYFHKTVQIVAKELTLYYNLVKVLRVCRKGGYKMNITDVRIRRMGEEGKMKAVASVTFDDEFVVHDIKIIDGQNGLFIAMPSRKVGEGDFRDVAHPLKSETRAKIKDAIFAEYDRLCAEDPAASAEETLEEELLDAAVGE